MISITGIAMTAAFVILRAWGVYGEPRPRAAQATPLLIALSFVNCTKQLPSLPTLSCRFFISRGLYETDFASPRLDDS